MYKIPVFYHIPKNAGTYVIDWLLIGFRHFRATETFWHKYHVADKGNIKTIQIKSNGLTIAKFLIGDPKYFIDTCNYLKKITKNDFIIDFDEELITKILQECFLFTVVIESSGFACREIILKFIRNHELHQFLILRDPFERCQSVFNYLTSDASKHEPTHGLLDQKNLEEYICSYQLSDSWVIRTLLNIEDKDPITKIHFNEIIDLFARESFFVYTMKNVDQSIRDALKNSYNIEIKDIVLGPHDQIERNKNEYKKIILLSLSEEAQEKFLKRTYWDRELYNYYNQISQNINSLNKISI